MAAEHDELIWEAIKKAREEPDNAEKHYLQAIRFVNTFYTDRLIRYFSPYFPVEYDIEAFVQDVLLNFYRSFPKYSFDSDGIEGWIFRIAWRRRADFYRNWYKVNEERQVYEDDINRHRQYSSLASSSEDDDEVSYGLELINQAFTSLTRDEQVIMGHVMDGSYSPRDLARILRMSEDNIRQIKRRGLKKLKSEVERLRREECRHGC